MYPYRERPLSGKRLRLRQLDCSCEKDAYLFLSLLEVVVVSQFINLFPDVEMLALFSSIAVLNRNILPKVNGLSRRKVRKYSGFYKFYFYKLSCNSKSLVIFALLEKITDICYRPKPFLQCLTDYSCYYHG